ncbi:hypothetical protein TI10_04870 [Photorhabdus luminescens subsp. luminescens]|uniref:Uncharacterized protein n=1 Tax=Photorhabdus luminescens TaxID=29488 RepID=A0A1G5Q9C6_PHOLU|nr:hypothetical protein [Photorhabdus luminescens]KMW75065.1 hypothetical protein TI10_04870 [Photorhabdus luminescens subsp. luminescens]SCZ58465.1 hypothetical protein SAMN02982990_01242 [Photorhabdus luminescens]
MASKGSRYIFVILSAISFQVFASNFDYKSDIPADNKPSAEYLKKRENLEPKHLDMNRDLNELIANNKAEKKWELERQVREIELRRKGEEFNNFNHFNDRFSEKIRQDLERDARIKENGGMTRNNFFDRE